MILSDGQIAAYVKNAGFTGEDIVTGIAVVLAESGGNTLSENSQNNTPPSTDRGLWQINDYWHSGVSDECAFDPSCASAYAFKLFTNRGNKFTDWAAYNAGTYTTYLERARAAAGNPDDLPDGPAKWTTIVLDLWKSITDLRNKQSTSTEPGFPMKHKDFVGKLIELIDTAVIKLQQDGTAPDSVIQYWQGQSEKLKHSEGFEETNTILEDMADWVKENLENVVSTVSDWVKEQSERFTGLLGVVGGTVAAVLVGVMFVAIGLYGVIGGAPGGAVAQSVARKYVPSDFRRKANAGK